MALRNLLTLRRLPSGRLEGRISSIQRSLGLFTGSIARHSRVQLALALATIVGTAAGYGAAKIYPSPFDMAAAAQPKVPPAPSADSAPTPAQFSPQANQPVPVVKPRTQS